MEGQRKRVGEWKGGEGRGREEMESRGGERERVENLLHWFMGDRRPCLTAVNSFFTFWRNTDYTLGGLLLVANFLYRP